MYQSSDILNHPHHSVFGMRVLLAPGIKKRFRIAEFSLSTPPNKQKIRPEEEFNLYHLYHHACSQKTNKEIKNRISIAIQLLT